MTTTPSETRPPVYTTKTVRAVRGLESRTQAKWEKDGWELVSQERLSALRSELTFRRVTRKQPWYLWAGIGAFLVIGVAGLTVAGALESHDHSGGQQKPAAASIPSETPTTSQVSTPPQPVATAPVARALSEATAAQYLATQWEAKFPYGGTVHWFEDRITTAKPDGSYTFKIGATVKNEDGTETPATIEGDVSGTGAAPAITDSILYTNDGQIVNFNG